MNKGFRFLLTFTSMLFLASCNTRGIEESSQSTVVTTYRTVSFVSNGGTEYEDIRVKDGDSVRLPTPEREDHEFLGWYDNANFTGEVYNGIFTPVEETTTFYAEWKRLVEIYTVHFEWDGIEDLTVRSDDNVITLPTIEQYGHRFNGWMLSESGEVYVGEYTVTSNVTFYPSFTEISYLYLYVNEGTDHTRLEYALNSTIELSSLPTPEPYLDDGYPCPFLKWIYQSGLDAEETIQLGSEPTILIAVYDHTGAPQKLNLTDLGDGSYQTTGRGVKAFYEAESVRGIWSMDLALYKMNGGAAGITFRMTDSGADYAFEDLGTSYICATISPSGALQIGAVDHGSWSTVKTIALSDLPTAFQEKYDALNYIETTITVFSEPTSFTIYLDQEPVYTNADSTLLSQVAYQGTGFGYRSSASGYTISNFLYEMGKVIQLDANGGDPFVGETYYWDKAKVVALPTPTTSVPNRVFDAWHYDQACTQPVDLTDPHFTDETILYASYRLPTSSVPVDNGDGTVTLNARTACLCEEVTYQNYSVETDLTFTKGGNGSFGLFIRGNIKGDDSYEAGNSYIAIQMWPVSNTFQFSKTGNGANFSHQSVTSVMTGETVKSPISSDQYFSEAWLAKYNAAPSGEPFTFNLKVVDANGVLDIYFDGEKHFTIEDTSTLFEGLDGMGIGYKTSHTNAMFTTPIVTEIV